tara:strand:+ start:1818 stop:1970 length:153 start_codon:yes stop_codon:yes gene_type:complete
MAKKLIEGKTRKSKGKKMSHTGGNSRPLKNLCFDEVTHKWHMKPEILEGE